MSEPTTLATIGRSTVVRIGESANVPAKVDTGADSSAIWATNIHEQDGDLRFTLFGPASEFYTGRELTSPSGSYRRVRIASSSGTRQERWMVWLPVAVDGRVVQAEFTLADRLTLSYPVLLGCSFLAGHFVVDVTKHLSDDLHHELVTKKFARKASVAHKE